VQGPGDAVDGQPDGLLGGQPLADEVREKAKVGR
jgi:hypothetical protein